MEGITSSQFDAWKFLNIKKKQHNLTESINKGKKIFKKNYLKHDGPKELSTARGNEENRIAKSQGRRLTIHRWTSLMQMDAKCVWESVFVCVCLIWKAALQNIPNDYLYVLEFNLIFNLTSLCLYFITFQQCVFFILFYNHRKHKNKHI